MTHWQNGEKIEKMTPLEMDTLWGLLKYAGLVQDCSISSAIAMEIMQSCTKSSIYDLQNSYQTQISQNLVCTKYPFHLPNHFGILYRACQWLFRVLCTIWKRFENYLLIFFNFSHKKYILRPITLESVVATTLAAPSHYLIQYWLIIKEFLWRNRLAKLSYWRFLAVISGNYIVAIPFLNSMISWWRGDWLLTVTPDIQTRC